MFKKEITRKEFIKKVLAGSLFTTFISGLTFKKVFAEKGKSKLYFRENPDSVKRLK